MRVAIIGSRGQLGSDLVKAFKSVEVIPLVHEEIEVTDYNSCVKLKSYFPDVVINTAAFHKTDACEDDPFKTFSINAIGSKNVVKICSEIGACYVYISTDYVFNGEKGRPYTEEDSPSPINTYGISKVAGEQYAKLAERYYIVRVSSLFGVAGASGKGGNFVETMIQKARNNEEIKVVDDMIMSPTYTKDAAGMIKKILEERVPYGIYHVVNDGFCSWYEFAETIFSLLNLKSNLKPIKTSDLIYKARRPKFSALENKKLATFGLKMPNWRDALKRYLSEKKYL
jgi:dTDP-4-dehydrorhamnose reductase